MTLPFHCEAWSAKYVIALISQWWTVWSRSANTGILHYVQDDDFTRMANGSREYA